MDNSKNTLELVGETTVTLTASKEKGANKSKSRASVGVKHESKNVGGGVKAETDGKNHKVSGSLTIKF